MKKQIGRFLGPFIVTGLALAVAIAVTAGGWGETDPDEAGNKTQAIPQAPVSVMEARLESIEITDTYSGMIRPLERFTLGFEIAGRVSQLGSFRPKAPVGEGQLEPRDLDEGDPVAKGDLLARLDDRAISYRLEETKAQRRQAMGTIEEARARRRKAKADMDRSERLMRRGGAAITAAEYETSVSQLEVAEAQLALAEAQLALAEAQIQTVKKNLDDTYLYSPVRGVISKRMINPGESVSPHQPVMEIIQVSDEWQQVEVLLVVGVPEAYVGDIRKGQKVHVELLARDRFGRKRPGAEGRVYRVAEAADQTTGLFEVEIWLPNKDGCWRPGLIALAHIVLKEVRGFRVPMTSAVFRDGKTFLFAVQNDGKPVLAAGRKGAARRLELEDWIEQGPDLILLESQLPPGHRAVVTRGQHRLVHGRPVEVVLLPGQKGPGAESGPAIRPGVRVAGAER